MLGAAPQSIEMLSDYQNIEMWMKAHGFESEAEKVREIFGDSKQGSSVTVAFCGLFSAGKSSLINALVGETTLATGAVPTTAQIDEVYLVGTDNRVRILDTPGVDSTDDAHRQATMNALHRADVICLVADYQHVEAEENLDLLRVFTDEAKRLVLIVNQVDKHLDFELSMESFQRRVEETLDDYGILVERVFYTSTNDSPYNQVKDLANWLYDLQNLGEAERLGLVRGRLHDLVEKTVSALYREGIEDAQSEIAKVFDYAPLDVREAKDWFIQVEPQVEAVRRRLADARQQREQVHLRKREEWIRTIELAQISPYETTEKGRHYIESMRPDFKVGVFRSAKKTELERHRRAQVFVDDLAEHVDHYLITPLRNQVYQDIQDIPWTQPAWMKQVEQISVGVDVDYVVRQMKQGALVSTQYPYQYVKDVISRVKRDVMAMFAPMIDAWFEDALQRFDADHADLVNQLHDLQTRSALLTTYITAQESCKAQVESLLAGGEA